MFNKIFKNRERRVLLENFLSLSAIQAFSLLLPLVTLPYIIRVIGLEKYGVIVLSWSLIYYFTSVTDFSFKITATRDVAIFKDNKKKLNIIYSKVMILQALLQIFSYIIILIVVYSYSPFYNERLIFWLTMPFLFGNTIFPDWFFQGIEKMKYITFINLAVKSVFTILVFVLIKDPGDYWIYPLLQTSGFVLSGIIGQFFVIKIYGIRFHWISKKSLVYTFKENIPIFVNQFLPNLYNNTSIFLLGILTNTTLVGIFDAIRKIINVCSTLIDLVSRVFFPFINRNRGSFAKYRKLMGFTGFSLMILPIIFYKLILSFLNINDSRAFLIITILAIGILFLAIYDIYGINYFIVNRMDKIVMNNTLVASLVGLIISFPLIHFYSIVGAAISITISRCVMGLGLYYKYNSLKINPTIFN